MRVSSQTHSAGRRGGGGEPLRQVEDLLEGAHGLVGTLAVETSKNSPISACQRALEDLLPPPWRAGPPRSPRSRDSPPGGHLREGKRVVVPTGAAESL